MSIKVILQSDRQYTDHLFVERAADIARPHRFAYRQHSIFFACFNHLAIVLILRAESGATEESYKEDGKIPGGGLKQLLQAVADDFEKQSAFYEAIDVDSATDEVLRRMYNRFTDY